MKWLVCGGREYRNFDSLSLYLDLEVFHNGEPDLLIHGNAGGADRMAGEWAEARGIQPVRMPALWNYYRSGAGPIRNGKMLLLHPDIVYAFPGGKGTEHMVEIATEHGIQVVELDAPPVR